jgi:hypothetical protein
MVPGGSGSRSAVQKVANRAARRYAFTSGCTNLPVPANNLIQTEIIELSEDCANVPAC